MNVKNDNHTHESCCSEYADLSRRRFLKGSGLIGAAGFTAPAWMPKVAFGRARGGGSDVIIALNLRGAIDGLSFVVPHHDGDYYANRPMLAVPQPGQTDGAVDLDGFFGLNPNASALMTPYSNNHLAVFHAAGSTDPTRSHFDGMASMDGGVPDQNAVGIDSGWLGRHLQATTLELDELRGMAIEPLMPLVLNGSDEAIPVADPANFGFPGRAATEAARRTAIEAMYAAAAEPLGSAMTSTMESIDQLQAINFAGYTPEPGVTYPNSPFGQKLRASAIMIKAGIALEAIAIDYGGWDHHNGQGPLTGLLANMLNDLSSSLEAFYLDLLPGGYMNSTTLVMLSEFGRRVAENVSLGTDHGHGNMMMVLSGNTAGGQVHGTWPGLAPGQLDMGLDLAITTDYRDVVGEILVNRAATPDLGIIFPNHTFNPPGVTT